MAMTEDHLLAEKRALLAAMLPHVPFDGWTAKALSLAARDAGLDSGVALRAFPGGAPDVLDLWVSETDAAMLRVLEGRREAFVATAAEKLLVYALGRGVEYYDQPAIRKIVRDAAPGDYTWSSIIVGITRSVPFQMKVRRES